MQNVPIRPYIRVAWNDKSPLPWEVDPRVIFDFELIFWAEGNVIYTVRNKTYHLVPGDIVIIHPKQEHSLRAISGEYVRQPHIHFDLIEDESSPNVYVSFNPLSKIDPHDYGLFRQDVLDEICPNCPDVFHPDDPDSYEALFLKLIVEFGSRRIYSSYAVQGLFMQLFAMLMRDIAVNRKNVKSNTVSSMEQVRDYLNKNLDREVSLDELAEQIHISKFYLCRQFKQEYGVSPIQYHLDSRIDQAKWLLMHTNLPIGEIAERVGFDNIYSFSRAFKSRESVSPSVYRK